VTEGLGGLFEAFFNHTGRVSDKWEQYLTVYSSELDQLRAAGRPLRLLEIGVQNGGSLEIWQTYLPQGSTILGLDINPDVAQLTFASDRIEVKIVDATQRIALEDALGNSTFDVIVDDGSHLCGDVITTFDILFDHLAAGGKYFIEDLHTSYYPAYNGGYRRVGSSIEWLKSLADALHFDHIDSAENIPQKEATYLSHWAKALAKVSFFDSMCVIEKLSHPKLRPYRRIFTGTNAQVCSFGEVLTLKPVSQLMDLTFVTPAARQMEQAVVEHLAQLGEREKSLSRRIEECESTIASLQDALSRSEAERKQIGEQLACATQPETIESEFKTPAATE
jgi:hypothetical protein